MLPSMALGKVTWEDRSKGSARTGRKFIAIYTKCDPVGRHNSSTSFAFSLSSLTLRSGFFLVFPNSTILVGRDEARNHVAFEDPVVSRSQLEIFSIVVDEEYKHSPLVFVRDRGSANGTAVNGEIIGKGAKLSPSRLLEDGDIITIGPGSQLRLTYSVLLDIQPSYTLSHLQRQEVEVRRVP